VRGGRRIGRALPGAEQREDDRVLVAAEVFGLPQRISMSSPNTGR
jgi:hypothetical protein